MKEITTSAILGTLSLLSCIAAVHLFEDDKGVKASLEVMPSPPKEVIDKKLEDNAMQTLTEDYPPSTMKSIESRCF